MYSPVLGKSKIEGKIKSKFKIKFWIDMRYSNCSKTFKSSWHVERLWKHIEHHLEITKSNISSTTRWEQKPTLLIKITSGKIAKRKMCFNFLPHCTFFCCSQQQSWHLILTTLNETQLDKCSFEIICILLDTYISSQLWY